MNGAGVCDRTRDWDGSETGMSALGKEDGAKHGGDVGVVSIVWCEAVCVLFQSVYGYVQVVCGGQRAGGIVGKDCKPGSQHPVLICPRSLSYRAKGKLCTEHVVWHLPIL